MMELRFLDLNTVTPEQLKRWEQWIAPEKRRRIDCLPPLKRLQSLCGDGLARELLAERLHIAPEAVVFTYTETGKPLTEGAFFSVSHSGDAVVCTISGVSVGVDVERIRTVPARLGRKLAGEGEWQTEQEFWQRWTRREAAIKCRGETLSAWKRSGEEEMRFSRFDFPGYAVTVCEEEE